MLYGFRDMNSETNLETKTVLGIYSQQRYEKYIGINTKLPKETLLHSNFLFTFLDKYPAVVFPRRKEALYAQNDNVDKVEYDVVESNFPNLFVEDPSNYIVIDRNIVLGTDKLFIDGFWTEHPAHFYDSIYDYKYFMLVFVDGGSLRYHLYIKGSKPAQRVLENFIGSFYTQGVGYEKTGMKVLSSIMRRVYGNHYIEPKSLSKNMPLVPSRSTYKVKLEKFLLRGGDK